MGYKGLNPFFLLLIMMIIVNIIWEVWRYQMNSLITTVTY